MRTEAVKEATNQLTSSQRQPLQQQPQPIIIYGQPMIGGKLAPLGKRLSPPRPLSGSSKTFQNAASQYPEHQEAADNIFVPTSNTDIFNVKSEFPKEDDSRNLGEKYMLEHFPDTTNNKNSI